MKKNWLFNSLVVVFEILRVLYFSTRDLFESGPDANGYIPAAIGFADKGFVSSSIPGIPFYPPLYPYLMSGFINLFGANWVIFFQLTQSILIVISAFLVLNYASRLYGSKIGYLSAIVFVMSPALIVVPGEAMPESLLTFVLSFYLFLIVKVFQDSTLMHMRDFLALAFVGGVFYIAHPRIFPIHAVVILYIFLFFKTRIFKKAFFLIVTFIPYSIFGIRNLVANGDMNISTSATIAIGAGHPNSSSKYFAARNLQSYCEDVICLFKQIQATPAEWLSDSVNNLVSFWTPYSGPNNGGNWFHNISLLAQMQKHGFTELASVFSVILSIWLFLFFVIGAFRIIRDYQLTRLILLFAMLAIWGTASIIYGNSLHRLTVLPLLIPIQILGLIELKTILIRFYQNNFNSKKKKD